MNPLAKEFKSKNKNALSNLWSNLSLWHLIVFGVIGIIAIKITSNPEVDTRYNYIIYGVLIGIIVLMATKSDKSRVRLDQETATNIAIEECRKLRDDGKAFHYDSKIEPSGMARCRFSDNMATGFADYVSWDIGIIERVHGKQYKKYYVMEIHPYDGSILGFYEAPLGYTGRESLDKVTIPVGVVMETQKTTDITNKDVSN